MASEYRQVEVASGHRILARRLRRNPSQRGRVIIEVRGRSPIEVDEGRWNAAEVHRG